MILTSLKVVCTLEECFEKINLFCEKYKEKLYTSEIMVYSEDKKRMFEFDGVKPKYMIKDEYKELEPTILEIFNKHYLNCHSYKKTISVDELKNMNVKIKGYAMWDDNSPDFYTRCKVSEALAELKECADNFPQQFSALTFYVSSVDGVDLFSINRELTFESICLTRINELCLTKEMVKEALGIE